VPDSIDAHASVKSFEYLDSAALALVLFEVGCCCFEVAAAAAAVAGAVVAVAVAAAVGESSLAVAVGESPLAAASLRENYDVVVAVVVAVVVVAVAASLHESYNAAAVAEPVSWPPPSLIVVAQTWPSDGEVDCHQPSSAEAASTAAVLAAAQLDYFLGWSRSNPHPTFSIILGR